MESTQPITTTLLLTIGQSTELLSIERKIDFPSIIASQEKSVMLVRKESYDQLHDLATLAATSYLAMCFPSQTVLAPAIAKDLIDSRPTWKVADFINVFKFFRQRCGDIEELKVYGNTITLPKIMGMVAVYEDHRAQALEAHHAKNKGTLAEENKKLNDVAQSVAKRLEEKNGKYEPKDEVMGREFDKVQEDRDRTHKNVLYRNEAPDERFFNKLNKTA